MKSIVIVGVLVTTVAVGATAAGTGAIDPGDSSTRAVPLDNQPMEIPLWEGGAPGALGDADIDKPTLTIYRAARVPTGTGRAINHERWLIGIGVFRRARCATLPQRDIPVG